MCRYKEELEGVVLCYKKCRVVERNARIINENPLLHFHVNVEFLVFAPSAARCLAGTVAKQSADHLGLLVLGLFNAAVSRKELEKQYRWNKQVRCWEHKWTKKMLETGVSELLLAVKRWSEC
jgi:DNA-directed RNA polymerase I subunit RPA43